MISSGRTTAGKAYSKCRRKAAPLKGDLSRGKLRRRPTHQGIAFLRLNALTALPFPDKSFDLCIASHVAHGLKKEDRLRLYAQMNRLARQRVVVHDYNQNRSPVVTLLETLEGGDYFRFILEAEGELRAFFPHVEVLQVGKRACWYICTPYLDLPY